MSSKKDKKGIPNARHEGIKSQSSNTEQVPQDHEYFTPGVLIPVWYRKTGSRP